MEVSSFFPITILMRFYSLIVLWIDLVYFLFYTWLQVIKAVLHLFKSAKNKSIVGEVALVVGASRGIGREISLELALLGAEVVCIDINSVGNEATVKQIRMNRGKAHAFTCDVTNKELVNKTIKTIEQDVGPISMLFHCCGLPSPRSYSSEPPPIQTTLDVSVVSHFWLLEAIAPSMMKRRQGHIVLLTSVASISGFKQQMPLSVAQFAVQGLFESLTENIRQEKMQNSIIVSLVHIYPFIVSKDLANDISMRVPNCFGSIDARKAAKCIMSGVLKDETEISIPKHVLYLGHILRLLPRKSTVMLRELLDTGVDFA